MAIAPKCMFDLLAVGHKLEIEFEESLLDPNSFSRKEFEEYLLHSKDILPFLDIRCAIFSRK